VGCCCFFMGVTRYKTTTATKSESHFMWQNSFCLLLGLFARRGWGSAREGPLLLVGGFWVGGGGLEGGRWLAAAPGYVTVQKCRMSLNRRSCSAQVALRRLRPVIWLIPPLISRESKSIHLKKVPLMDIFGPWNSF